MLSPLARRTSRSMAAATAALLFLSMACGVSANPAAFANPDASPQWTGDTSYIGATKIFQNLKWNQTKEGKRIRWGWSWDAVSTLDDFADECDPVDLILGYCQKLHPKLERRCKPDDDYKRVTYSVLTRNGIDGSADILHTAYPFGQCLDNVFKNNCYVYKPAKGDTTKACQPGLDDDGHLRQCDYCHIAGGGSGGQMLMCNHPDHD